MSANAALQSESRVSAVDLVAAALPGFETLLEAATVAVRRKVEADGRISSARLEAEQHAAHGLSWLATYVEAIRQLLAYATRMREEGKFGEIEELQVRIGFGECVGRIVSSGQA